MKKKFLLFALGFAPLASQANLITAEQAQAAAAQFFAGQQARSSRTPLLPLTLVGHPAKLNATSEEAPSYYIFNRGNEQGFVIIAGDDAVNPVLGYALHGSFGDKPIPDGLSAWMQQKDEQIAAVRKAGTEPTDEIRQRWETLSTGTPVVQLETAKWDQREPYNAYLPGIADWHGYTGCTITATAIVMAYHQWPDCGVGNLKGYYTSGLGVDVPGITLGHPYQWDKMPGINGNEINPDPSSSEYLAQEDAVSTLMRDLGVMFKARYDYDATSADIEVVPFKIVRHMKYHEGVMHLKEEHFSEAVWQKLLREELDENRPIIFAGYKKDGSEGHSIVLDGYDDLGCFSVNWGWSGSYNGFYSLESMRAGSYGSEYAPGGYSERQEALLRVQPDRPDADIRNFEKMIFTIKPLGGSNAPMGLQVSETETDFVQGATFTVSAGAFMNLGSVHFAGPLKLAITDSQGHVKKELYTTPGQRDMVPGSAMMPLDEARDFVSVTLEEPVEAGDRIRLLFPTQNGEWQAVTCEEPDGQWEIVLKEGDVTGIDRITKDETSDGKRYDLSGRPVSQPERGSIYIENGKKIRMK